jgi:8-oxo-dGTP diphosphatase
VARDTLAIVAERTPRANNQATIIVDGANVVGARADGWWKDRRGAAARMRDDLTRLAADGTALLPAGMTGSPGRAYPEIVLVVEGAARATAGPAAGSRLRVVAAPGSGDDTIARLAAEIPGPRLVVTADRDLRRRSVAAGARVIGPHWLLAQL